MAAVVMWVREVVSGRISQYEAPPGALVRDLLPSDSRGPLCDFYVKCNGRRVDTEEQLQSGHVYSVELRLLGGKGGFGSMLRALGAQIEKTTNREACRDLSGRRLRDVNHEKAMAEWIKKQAEREAEKEQRRMERLKRKLAEPKHYFTDPEYQRQCSDMSERLEDSVIKGLQASSSSTDSSDTQKRRKEPKSSNEKSGKKKCLWTGLEGLEASPCSESGSESDSESSSTSASCSSAGHGLQSSDSDSDEPAQCSSSYVACEQSPEYSGAGSSADVEQPVCDPDEQPQCSSSITTTEPCTQLAEGSWQVSADVKQPVCVPEEQPQCSASITTSEPCTQHNEADGSRQESADGEQPKTSSEPEKPPETSTVDTASFDLLAFTSASELEALGLEKSKVELMALGLKCGGTLQERAARLFSVRGLTREQIDPSLFAKPAKGKKK